MWSTSAAAASFPLPDASWHPQARETSGGEGGKRKRAMGAEGRRRGELEKKTKIQCHKGPVKLVSHARKLQVVSQGKFAFVCGKFAFVYGYAYLLLQIGSIPGLLLSLYGHLLGLVLHFLCLLDLQR